jgi:hypothetical protein
VVVPVAVDLVVQHQQQEVREHQDRVIMEEVEAPLLMVVAEVVQVVLEVMQLLQLVVPVVRDHLIQYPEQMSHMQEEEVAVLHLDQQEE